MTEFKKVFKNVYFFLFLLPVIYVIMLILWGDFGPDYLKSNLSYQNRGSGHLFSRIKDVDTTKNVDILFLGSSRSYRHYDTRIYNNLGYSAFNLASSAQTFIQMEYFIEKYFEQLNPEIVVVDIYPLMFSGDGVESSLDVISNDNFDADVFSLATQELNIKLLNTLIYSLYREKFHNSNELEVDQTEFAGRNQYIAGGFVERELEITELQDATASTITINERQLEAFNNIMAILKNSNARIHLVCSPMHQSQYQSYSNFHILDSLASQHKLVVEKFIDLPALNEEHHFYDPYHLNQDGVEIFNEVFIKNSLKIKAK